MTRGSERWFEALKGTTKQYEETALESSLDGVGLGDRKGKQESSSHLRLSPVSLRLLTHHTFEETHSFEQLFAPPLHTNTDLFCSSHKICLRSLQLFDVQLAPLLLPSSQPPAALLSRNLSSLSPHHTLTMPATRKSFSRAHHTGKKTAPGLALSSFTSKTNPTSTHNAKRRAPAKKNEATKERDREIMEGINRDVGYKGQAFMGGIVSPQEEGWREGRRRTKRAELTSFRWTSLVCCLTDETSSRDQGG